MTRYFPAPAAAKFDAFEVRDVVFDSKTGMIETLMPSNEGLPDKFVAIYWFFDQKGGNLTEVEHIADRNDWNQALNLVQMLGGVVNVPE